MALMVAHLNDDCFRKHRTCCIDSFTIAVGTSVICLSSSPAFGQYA